MRTVWIIVFFLSTLSSGGLNAATSPEENVPAFDRAIQEPGDVPRYDAFRSTVNAIEMRTLQKIKVLGVNRRDIAFQEALGDLKIDESQQELEAFASSVFAASDRARMRITAFRYLSFAGRLQEKTVSRINETIAKNDMEDIVAQYVHAQHSRFVDPDSIEIPKNFTVRVFKAYARHIQDEGELDDRAQNEFLMLQARL